MLLRQMEYFRAVVEAGSFYEAAERSHVSQSAISQQIKKLEDELGTALLTRHNRTFSLTSAGEHFYRKSLVIAGDIEQLVRETRRMGAGEERLTVGCYQGYVGEEFSLAIARFSAAFPAVRVQTVIASHDELYRLKKNNTVDIAFNDQRRAFSAEYHNEILAESTLYVELAASHPLARLGSVELAELKNIPCIIVAGEKSRAEEQRYYEEVIGMRGDFVAAPTMAEGELRVLTGAGYLPIDVIGQPQAKKSLACLRVLRGGEPIRKNYCAFWRRDSVNPYAAEFAKILAAEFAGLK